MADIVTPEVRSRMMAGIRGRDTKPELVLRKGLHRAGFRYRLHARGLPGKPDMVFPKHGAVIFAHGCFWHGHDCALFRWPTTRQEFWTAKITGNRERDARVKASLLAAGWRVLTVWECALKGTGRLAVDKIIDRCSGWLHSRRRSGEIRGSKRG
jgi:DNA mismatch endonuclease, patch repair protein